jgi:hypothetical protein
MPLATASLTSERFGELANREIVLRSFGAAREGFDLRPRTPDDDQRAAKPLGRIVLHFLTRLLPRAPLSGSRGGRSRIDPF